MRIEKIQIASFVTSIIKDSEFLFFISYKGLNVGQFTDLRNKLYAVEAKCHVLKNSLIHLGFRHAEIDFPSDLRFSGDTAAVFGHGDPCPAAKVLKDFGKELDVVQFKAGMVDGNIVDATDAARIAELPSKEIIRSQLLGLLEAPMANLVRVFNAKTASLVYLLQAYIDKKEKSS